MQTDWTYQFLNTTTFILGNKKNAGKTTFMNYALNNIRKNTCPAIGSIGIDGESNDLIDGRPKPSILTTKGDIVITTYPKLKKSNAKFKLLKVFPFYTVLGQIVIAETIRNGNIELVGTENNKQLNEIIIFLKEEFKCNTIVFDGAANRITPITSGNNTGFFYVLGINLKNIKESIETMKLLSFISTCKHINQIEKKELRTIYKVDGALTTTKLAKIPSQYNKILINNISSVFLSCKQITECIKHKQIIVNNNYKLSAFVTILKDVDEKKFVKHYQKNNIRTQLITNPYVD